MVEVTFFLAPWTDTGRNPLLAYLSKDISAQEKSGKSHFYCWMFFYVWLH